MSDNDNEITSVVPGARTPLSESMKKLANGIRLYTRKPYTEEIGGEVEVHEAVKDGVVTGVYVKKDNKVIETMSTPEAQQSGDDKKQAKAAGVKEEDTTPTTATMVAKKMSKGKDTDWGKGAHEAGETSKNQVDTPHEPEETKKVDFGKGKTKEVKPKDPKEGSKPDNSMSKMASMKSGPQTSESMEKSNYDIQRQGDTLVYTKQKPGQPTVQPAKPEAPNWKKNWDAKPVSEKQAFQKKLSDQRQTIGKAPTPPKPATMGKSDVGPGSMMKFVRSCKMHYEKLAKLEENTAPMEKADLKGIPGGKANQNPDQWFIDRVKRGGPERPKPKPKIEVVPHPEEVDQNVDPEIINNMKSRLAEQKPGKPELVREMMRMKSHTSSGRPFRVMAGTHPDHKKLAGEHVSLDTPMNPKQMYDELKKPTSHLSRKVLDAIDGGHDIMYVHQPEDKMQKNMVAGYPGMGATPTGVGALAMSQEWTPTPHTSRPEKMNQSEGGVRPKYGRRRNRGETYARHVADVLKKADHQQYAANLLGRVKAWSAGKNQRKQETAQNQSAVDQIMSAHNKNGGATFNLKEGHKSGDLYAVSPYLDRSVVLDGPMQPQHVHNFINQNKDLLGKPGHNVGTWYDPDSKKTFLDISVTTPDKNNALKLAQKHNQKAIFHLGSMTTIPTGGTGLK